jgi:hypothetical protein
MCSIYDLCGLLLLPSDFLAKTLPWHFVCVKNNCWGKHDIRMFLYDCFRDDRLILYLVWYLYCFVCQAIALPVPGSLYFVVFHLSPKSQISPSLAVHQQFPHDCSLHLLWYENNDMKFFHSLFLPIIFYSYMYAMHWTYCSAMATIRNGF